MYSILLPPLSGFENIYVFNIVFEILMAIRAMQNILCDIVIMNIIYQPNEKKSHKKNNNSHLIHRQTIRISPNERGGYAPGWRSTAVDTKKLFKSFC